MAAIEFENLVNVIDQKDSGLCVAVSFTGLLYSALKNDLKLPEDMLMITFSPEKIFTRLTMEIYPRSMAGLNLKPNDEEKEFQMNDIETLFRRMKFPTYLNPSGWDYIRTISDGKTILWEYEFDYEQGNFLSNHYVFE